MNLHEFDLNLLVVFDAIYTEQSLTRAGLRIGLSQSAISHALGRLRKAFEDPLFVRQGNRMVPTVMADEISVSVRQSLGNLQCTLEDRGCFDPQRSEAIFTVGVNDYTAFVLLPELARVLKTLAPHVRIETRHLAYRHRWPALEDAKVDLAISCSPMTGANICRQLLFEDRDVCMVRRDHPAFGDVLSLEQYVSVDFIRLHLSEYSDDPVDEELAALGLKRKVAMTVEHELTIPILVSQSDFAANISERVASSFVSWLPVRVLPIPLQRTGFQVHQYWHSRHQLDPSHRWLRRSVKALADGLAKPLVPASAIGESD